jgi:hypothetical protein
MARWLLFPVVALALSAHAHAKPQFWDTLKYVFPNVFYGPEPTYEQAVAAHAAHVAAYYATTAPPPAVTGTLRPQATGRDELLPSDCGREIKDLTGKLCYPDGLLCSNSKWDPHCLRPWSSGFRYSG